MPCEPAAGGRDVLGAGAEVSGAAAELEAEEWAEFVGSLPRATD